MKIAEFANKYRVSERHVRRLIQKYGSDMAGHFEKRGNEGTFLDDVGVEFLKSKLKASFEVVTGGPSERERQLENTITELSMRYAAACEKLVENAGAVALLEAAKEKEIALEARMERAEADRLQAAEALEQMRREAQMRVAQAEEAEEARAKAEERAEAAELYAEAAGEKATQALAQADALREQMEKLATASWLERRKILKAIRKETRE